MYKKNDYKSPFMVTPFFALNKNLMQKVGLTESIVLIHLHDLWSGFFKNEEWFFQQRRRICKDLCINKYAFEKALIKLRDVGFIETEIKFNKMYFKINIDKIKYAIINSEQEKVLINKNSKFLQELD